MKNQSSIENILNRNPELSRKVSMLAFALENDKKPRNGVLCYCASTSELYEKFCDYLTEQMSILPEAVFKVYYTKDNGRNTLGQYLLTNIISIEKAPGDIAFIQAKGFTELVADILDNDNYTLSRLGHDYDQIAKEDFHRNLGRHPSKVIFSLTHINKNHDYYQKAIQTAIVSQFKFLIFDI